MHRNKAWAGIFFEQPSLLFRLIGRVSMRLNILHIDDLRGLTVILAFPNLSSCVYFIEEWASCQDFQCFAEQDYLIPEFFVFITITISFSCDSFLYFVHLNTILFIQPAGKIKNRQSRNIHKKTSFKMPK
jgi:hypothetical protein